MCVATLPQHVHSFCACVSAVPCHAMPALAACPQGMVSTPSLEFAAAAGDSDPTRGRQLGRVTLLKKEFGFIRQVRA